MPIGKFQAEMTAYTPFGLRNVMTSLFGSAPGRLGVSSRFASSAIQRKFSTASSTSRQRFGVQRLAVLERDETAELVTVRLDEVRGDVAALGAHERRHRLHRRRAAARAAHRGVHVGRSGLWHCAERFTGRGAAHLDRRCRLCRRSTRPRSRAGWARASGLHAARLLERDQRSSERLGDRSVGHVPCDGVHAPRRAPGRPRRAAATPLVASSSV